MHTFINITAAINNDVSDVIVEIDEKLENHCFKFFRIFKL